MIKLIFIVFILFVVPNAKLFACDCMETTVENVFNETEVIVRGNFISVKNAAWPLRIGETESDRLYSEGFIVIVEVLKANSIKVGDTIQVFSDYSSCSVYYKNKSEYLFFASKKDKGIISNACSFTSEFIDIETSDYYKRAKKMIKN